MKSLAVLWAVLVSMLLTSCAATQYPAEDLDDPRQTQICRPGFYFCPGEVMGCCPNGWGCASTHCIKPRPKRKAVDRTCRPGYYFCPGEVMGCCPNGWGCASTHCVRPKGKLDL